MKFKLPKLFKWNIKVSYNIINITATQNDLIVSVCLYSFPLSTNADLYRSIAISSILSKILDYIIIDQHADSSATSDYQFGFKSNSSTMMCSTIMLIETIQ